MRCCGWETEAWHRTWRAVSGAPPSLEIFLAVDAEGLVRSSQCSLGLVWLAPLLVHTQTVVAGVEGSSVLTNGASQV